MLWLKMAGLARTNSTAATQPWWLTEVQRLQREDGARSPEPAPPSPVHSDDEEGSIDIEHTDDEEESDPEPTTSDEEFIATSDSSDEEEGPGAAEHGRTLPGP